MANDIHKLLPNTVSKFQSFFFFLCIQFATQCDISVPPCFIYKMGIFTMVPMSQSCLSIK